MSKSRNSKSYQVPHGEDLEYENQIFGERHNTAFNKPKIKRIEERRMQRHTKHQFREM